MTTSNGPLFPDGPLYCERCGIRPPERGGALCSDCRPPRNMAEFRRRSQAGNATSGKGEMMLRHIPCPFCAAPGFAMARVAVAGFGLDSVHTCRECNRSARVEDPAAETIVWVQTAGDDPPAWLEPPIRRATP